MVKRVAHGSGAITAAGHLVEYFRYTELMTTTLGTATTIKVTRATHRRLKAGAQPYRSINDYLEHLINLEERQRMVEEMRQAIAATSPEQIASWRSESRQWETAQLADTQ